MNSPAAGAVPPPRTILSFAAVALIWGSTWYVITGQIAAAPPTWAIAWRFMLATPAMFLLAAALGNRLALDRRGHGLAAIIGLFQFCGNFNFVYRAEMHLTSGVVAVLFVLIIVSNAVLARLLLGERTGRGFWAGGAIAFAGMALLLIHEARAGILGGDVPLGAAFALLAVLTASVANVIQAGGTGRRTAMAALLAWSMLYGTLANVVLALVLGEPLALPDSAAFWSGLAFLALGGSVVTFPLYYGLIRQIGAGRAAYQNIFVIIVAMLISTALEDYDWSLLAVLGALLALSGTFMALRARTRPPGVAQPSTASSAIAERPS